MNKRYYEHTLPIIRGSLSNTYGMMLFLKNKNNKFGHWLSAFGEIYRESFLSVSSKGRIMLMYNG